MSSIDKTENEECNYCSDSDEDYVPSDSELPAENNSSYENDTKVADPEENQDNAEQKKKRIDDLWAGFLADTQSTSDASDTQSAKTANESQEQSSCVDSSSAATFCVIPNFSGSDRQLEASFADSTEKHKNKEGFWSNQNDGQSLNSSTDSNTLINKEQTPSDSPLKNAKIKRVSGSEGLVGAINALSKKPKLSTLKKSGLDWQQFKDEKGIDSEIEQHNRGKHGYIDRQDFLLTADYRRFLIEKEARDVVRKKRQQNNKS